LRGPLGHGFVLPPSARKIALIAFDDSPARLRGVISLGLKQDSEMVLISNSIVENLPEAVEIQPLQAASEICKWADFIAFDAARENLNQLQEILKGLEQVAAVREAQLLVRTSMPCGGLAECGVCAVTIQHDWKMTCKDGPVFLLKDIIY
jgi:dihydroorotate dehydrogenase electron transfer subunit